MTDEEVLLRHRAESLLKNSGIVPDSMDKPVTRKDLWIACAALSGVFALTVTLLHSHVLA